jgi:hypothetical protein
VQDGQERRETLDHAGEDLARHGVAAPRGQAPSAAARDGRFGYMFPDLSHPDPGDDAIEALATSMIALAGTSDQIPKVPAGYTYLGQFVDHDITFDPTSKLRRENDPRALVDFRTPRFDLDSLYGSGPADQPFLYDWTWAPHPGVKLLVGWNAPDSGLAPIDLPRNQQGRALIGDGRNDENLIVSQLTLLFIRFHNKVVDRLDGGERSMGSTALFEAAQRAVRWHYQWIVTHDYLPKIVGDVATAVLHPGVGDAPPTVERRFYKWRDRPFMPVEFSAAAFRFGHSMVREDYTLNGGPNVPIFRPRGECGPHLGGFRPLPAALEIGWEHFFQTTHTRPQRSQRIDPSLATPLSTLPPDEAALARLNLQRGQALGLPAGLDVAHAMGAPKLSEEQLLKPLGDALDHEIRAALLRATPLWYYILREAEVLGGTGIHLGPVGARIVAEVLVGLLEADPNSYLSTQPTWKPTLPSADHDDFTMADLVRFTLRDEAH